MTSSKWLNALVQPNRQLLGKCLAFKRLLKEVDVVCASDLTVLITGETDVGKELVAQALHDGFDRRDRPFVSLNCAARNLGRKRSVRPCARRLHGRYC